jgi:shikimate kinase
MKKIILIGYRGTGKTTVGRLLGEHLGVSVLDSDVEVERRAGKTIAEIFAQDGEAAFREIEAEAIADLLQRDSFVLATGGGAVLRKETRQRLRMNGYVVWLTAKPETILQRIQEDKNSATMRPNLTTLPPREEILAVLEKRRSLYEETAHHIIETDGKSVEQIAAEIEKQY